MKLSINRSLIGDYFVMLKLINEIRTSVKSGLFRCALGMALTLPDICGQVEYPKEKGVRKRYEDWCNKYLMNQGYLTVGNESDNPDSTILTGDICYKLRCVYLHSGNINLNQRKGDKFPFFELRITSAEDNGIYIEPYIKNEAGKISHFTLDIRHLCYVLCNAAEEYYKNHEPKSVFEEHQFAIVDVENEAKKNIETNKILCERQLSKNDITDYSELSDDAKKLYLELKSENKEIIRKALLEDDISVIAAFQELLQGGFIEL